MESILEVIGGARLAGTTIEAKAGAVLGGVNLGVGSGDDRLGVAVGEGFCEPLTCKIRVEVGVDGHLVMGGLSEWGERRLRSWSVSGSG